MSPIVTEIVCGICGKRLEPGHDDVHWHTHSLIERSRYWVHVPFLRIGPWLLQWDSSGVTLMRRQKVGGNQLVWSWIWMRAKNPAKKR